MEINEMKATAKAYEKLAHVIEQLESEMTEKYDYATYEWVSEEDVEVGDEREILDRRKGWRDEKQVKLKRIEPVQEYLDEMMVLKEVIKLFKNIKLK